MPLRPLVSVVVPAYNIEGYIADCMRSAVNQTYPEIEIIVVNDGSTDSTLSIIEEFQRQDSRIRVITRPNGGLSAARNTGLDSAQGEYIVFADGDDVLMPDAIETMVGIASDTSADIVMGRHTRNEPVLADLSTATSSVSEPLNVKIVPSRKALINILYQKKNYHHSAWAKLYRRQIFEKLRFTPGLLYEDLDIVLRVFEACDRIALTDRTVYYYRPTPGSILNTFSTRRFDVLKITERLVSETTNDTGLNRAARNRRLSACFNILGLMEANNHTASHPDVALLCWSEIKRLRFPLLFNGSTRLKNRLGILASFGGSSFMRRLLKRHYS